MAEPFRPDFPGNPYRVDPIYLRMTLPRNTRDSRSSLPSVQDLFGELSVTSQFKITLWFGENVSTVESDSNLNSWLVSCGIFDKSLSSLQYEFMCHNAILPGSTLSTLEESGSRQGVMERFPIMRQFPELTLDFYVDADYGVIRLFEEWINFINPLHTVNGKSIRGSSRGSTSDEVSFDDENFYRMRYPNTYKRKISITKFERNVQFDRYGNLLESPSMLTYQFLNAFPVNLTALPVSYEGSNITKTSVTFNYDRYVVLKHNGTGSPDYEQKVTSSGQQILSATNNGSGSQSGQSIQNSTNNLPTPTGNTRSTT